MTEKNTTSGDLVVKLGDEESKTIKAYFLRGELEGLAAHRQLKYVPGKEEHKFTSRWQLTHVDSGTALLRPSQCTETLAHVLAIASHLAEFDWKKPPGELSADGTLRDRLDWALEQPAPEGDAVDPDDDSDLPATSRRYVVRRGETSGYDVYDTETESVVMNFVHRGFASEKARELNRGGS